MRIAVQFGLSFALLLTLCASAFAGTVADGVKIAFVGDTSTSAKFKEVLNLIKREKADLMIVPGDTDYGSGEAKWDGLIKSVLGDEAALIALGNHDYTDSNKDKIVALGMARLAKNPQIKCTGAYGEKMTCAYRGIYIVLSSIGSGGGTAASHEAYIQARLNAAPPEHWRVCTWHKNQREMQVGDKGNEVGWNAYETCREKGAIIVTGHEHSYARSLLLSNMTLRKIANPAASPLTVTEGTTFAIVSGLGGVSAREQLLHSPHWAKIYSATQSANFGVLFGVFKAKQAHFYMKTIDNKIIDDFIVNKGY